jgi:hypothetical protein
MENTNNNYQDIKGWGVDADPNDNPNYPIKHYNGDDHQRLGWTRPPLQPVTVEILESVEQARMPAVFGTKLPPSGLSGQLRRYAFKYDESEYGHWLNLLLADRINVVEGLLQDLKQFRIPNIFSERGMKADWKYNRKELVTKIIVAGVVATTLVFWLNKKKHNKA